MNLKPKLFEKYSASILQYNKIHKITGFKTKKEIEDNLFKDSIKAFCDIEIKNKKILDIGTGAGVPGIPLKIYEPSIALALLEVQQKRISFLKSLSWIDFKIIEGRAEEKFHKFIEHFDISTMRAIADIRICLELAIQFTKINGLIVLIKGPKCKKEIIEASTTAKALKCVLEKTFEYKNNEKTTIVVVYRKIAKTPKQFPRKFNKIKNQTL